MRRVIAIAALAAGFTTAGEGVRADEQSVTCRSKDYRAASCPIDRNATEVEMRRQLSGAACVHDRTWGARFGEIWVDKGCAAEFIVYIPSAGRGRDGEIVVCNSKDYRRQECAISDRVREVELVRKTSGAPCVYGQSWGFERGRLWVDRGCAGEFEVSVRDSDRGGARRRWDDRGRRPNLDMIFAERNAIRACRRYGEDHPDRLGANWADANPHESFDVEPTSRRGEEWTVVGRFRTFNRGREGTVRARCQVFGDRVTRFSAN